MVKTNTGRRWHRIAYAIASLCFFLGGGIVACSDTVRTDESRFIDREYQVVPPVWHPQENAILFRYIENGYSGPAFAVSTDGSRSETIVGADDTAKSSLSSDWSRLTYSREVKMNKQWNIFASDADGSNQSRLTDEETYDLAPVWSPDGSQIAFYSWRNNDGNLHLYAMSPDGSEQRYIAPVGNRNATPPSWSPDSNRIAFIVPRILEPEHRYRGTDLHVAVADGSSSYEVEEIIGFPAWSLDSNHLAFLKHFRSSNKVALYTIGADGSNPTEIYEFNDMFPTWYYEREANPHLAWSPDSTKILVSHRNLIAIVNTDDSDFQMLMRIELNQATELKASWSPDGSNIIVAVAPGVIYPDVREFSHDKSVALFAMDANGANRRILGWWRTEGVVRVEPGHNEPWLENLRWLEQAYDPPPARTPRAALNPTPQP